MTKLKLIVPDIEGVEKRDVLKALQVNKSATKGDIAKVEKQSNDLEEKMEKELEKLWNGITMLEKMIKEKKSSKEG